MQSQDKQDTFLALRGGLQGRMSLSFDLLENTLEVLQNRTADEPGSQSLQEMSELLDAARQELFKIFTSLGNSNPITVAGRRKLSSLLFS